MSEHRPAGVIHDIGYRGYDGRRESTAALVRALFVLGLRHCFGLGRTARSKVLPFLLLGINLLPAAIIVGVVTFTKMTELPLSYAAYTSQLQMPISLFAAAQAPVLFSRDLRHRSIVLYLARPLSPALFALTRWASLTVAILVFTLVPSALLYAGALLAGLDAGQETPLVLKSVVLQVVLAAMIAGLTGIISSWALRRGFAVVASIVVLIVGVGVVLLFQIIAFEEEIDTLGEVAGLASPWTLHNGLADAWGAGMTAIVSPSGAWTVIYAVAALTLVALCLLLLVRRFSKVGSR